MRADKQNSRIIKDPVMRKNILYKPSYDRFERIRRIRFPGQSRSEFCRAHGFATGAMSKWKAGQYTPTIDRVYALCKILGCRLEDLYNEMQPLVRQYDLPGIGNSELSTKPLPETTEAFLSLYEKLPTEKKLQAICNIMNVVNS